MALYQHEMSAAVEKEIVDAATVDAWLRQMPLAELADRCFEEAAEWQQVRNIAVPYAYELMRRALAEESAEAFAYVCRLYDRLVCHWVLRHRRFAQTSEDAEYFTAMAFQSFYFALRGDKFDSFPTVAAIMGYLKMCVHTAIAQYLRSFERGQVVPLDDATELATQVDFDESIEAAELWQWVCRQLLDERDRLLARAAFVQGLKPREIAAAYPDQWDSTRAISIALYRIRATLKASASDAALRG